jgi:type VI secretion system FHA domain protein
MWTLLLSRAGDPPGTIIDRRQIDAGAIKVGRNARTCDWVIPDDQGHISREHCTLTAMGLDLFVTDTSTNGVALNQPGSRIAPQMPVPVRMNDRLLLGDYVITVGSEAMAAGMTPIAPAPPPLPMAPAGGGQGDAWFETPVDPIWGGSPHNAEVHEFLGSAMHDFLGGPAKADPFAGPDPFAPVGALGEAFSRPILADIPPPPADFGIPEDWAGLGNAAPPAVADPFAPAPVPAGGGGDPYGAPPHADPFGAAPPVDPFGAPTPDPFGGPPADPFAAPPPDPFGGPPANSFGAPPPLDDDPFALPAARSEPVADPFAAMPAAPPTPPPPPPASATAGAEWAAFCEGAGLEPGELTLSADAMRKLGVLYRQVVLGLSDLIQDRAAFKDEFRVERTQLSMGRNNPFKHLPPLDSAKILLGQPLPGFLGSEEAVRSAFEDVKRHQLAMLAGVQHALSAVFDRLSPREIEKLMESAAGRKKGLPFTRAINPWTVYQTVFEALRRDAVSNANGVMSVAFREGYETFLKSGQ